MLDPTGLREGTGYMPIENYGLIGNMRTAALVATDGALDYLCWPNFDSPSIFCRILDRDKGGHFTISPPSNLKLTTKQQYLPSSNILQTMFYGEDGVMKLVDFFPRSVEMSEALELGSNHEKPNIDIDPTPSLREWLVRRVECVRSEIDANVEVLPAFNYARDSHSVSFSPVNDQVPGKVPPAAIFTSEDLVLELRTTIGPCNDNVEPPEVVLEAKRPMGDGNTFVTARLHLKEGQRVSFVLREYDPRAESSTEYITPSLLDRMSQQTKRFWSDWVSQSTYRGRWQEIVQRSLLTLKMLTYEPSGAIIAAATFSLAESVGGGRNWDYRFSWVRDSSFTIYILLRMGFKQEAEAYMTFIMERLKHNKTAEGGLPIMFSIHGGTDLPEIELSHLDGYRGSKPVRIGNGAAFHKQLDMYVYRWVEPFSEVLSSMASLHLPGSASDPYNNFETTADRPSILSADMANLWTPSTSTTNTGNPFLTTTGCPFASLQTSCVASGKKRI